jgi:hypothetical protein
MYRSAAAEPGTTEDHGTPGGKASCSVRHACAPGEAPARPAPGVASASAPAEHRGQP